MASRYQIVCMVVDCGSLKGAADELGYTQSAVSQAVKALERELGTTIIERGKQGVSLTRDGKQYLPYLRQIVTAEAELEGKRQELLGLSSTDIRIATFTNVSRTVLPRVIRDFGALHPGVRFTLKQGDYTRNAQWVHDGVVDFCFTARGFTAGLEKRVVYHDELVALLPTAHPLTAKEKVTLADLASEPFVLLDEGEQSLVLVTCGAWLVAARDERGHRRLHHHGDGGGGSRREHALPSYCGGHASRYSRAAHRARSLA